MGCTSSNDADGHSTSAPAKAPEQDKEASLPHTMAARFEIGEQIGEGGYAAVKIGTSKVDPSKKYAVKILKRRDMSKDDENAVMQEVKVLKGLHHRNIMQLHDFFEEPDEYYMILEYLKGGELFDRIVKKTSYNELEARDIVFILLQAIKYLHEKNIVHRDLKPENLLMASDNDDADVKIADFGFATVADGFSITSQCGTPGYIAPEILRAIPYGKPADMWSFGVILYILLGGYPPFHDDNQRNLFKKIVRGEYKFHRDYWKGISSEAKDLIRKLLTVDHHQRLTAQQALEHPWLGKSQAEIKAHDLQSNLETLRKYQRTRKLRAAVHTVIAAQRMKNLVAAINDAAESFDEPDEGGARGSADDDDGGWDEVNVKQIKVEMGDDLDK